LIETEINSSVSRSLLILECFSPRQPRLTSSEIQKHSGIPKSTLFRLLATLTGLNYLKYETETRKYFLGPKVLSLGFTVLENQEGREIARPYLQKLSQELDRSVNLLMLDRDEMVFIERIKVPGLMDLNIGIGSRIPAYNTAAGRAVLAHLNEGKFRETVDQIRKNPKASRYIGKNAEKLRACLMEVRKQGYATNDEESRKGIRALAVPIFSAQEVQYAMHLVTSSESISIDELRQRYAPRLIEVGKELSQALGHQDGKARRR
jgi:IclR family transcriptional regulator, pca regulon regulatory protein